MSSGSFVSRALQATGRVACAFTFLALRAAALDSAPPGELTRSDFATGIEMTPSQSRPVHSVILPAEVYRGVTRADLADLRVFDAEGEAVPFALRRLADAPPPARRDVRLRFFPIHAPVAGQTALDSLVLHVERDGSGAVLGIRTQTARESSKLEVSEKNDGEDSDRAIVAWVIDRSSFDEPLVALRFELAPSDRDYVAPIVVETSDDLARFMPIGETQSLVALRHAGQSITRDRIEVPAVTSPYLRVRWVGGDAPPALRGVVGELPGRTVPPALVVSRIEGTPHPDDDHVVDFDLGGFIPVDRVRVVLPEGNALIEAELRAASRSAGTFSRVERDVYYRVERGGQSIEGPARDIPRRYDRVWQLVADARRPGWGKRLPSLEIAHFGDELIFLERGRAPFTLAFGHYAAGPAAFPADEILAALSAEERAALSTEEVRLSPARPIAGEAARVAPPPPTSWTRFVLWSVLVLGVSALGIAALRLARALRD